MSQIPAYRWQPSTEEFARRAGIASSSVIRFDHNTSPSAPPWIGEEAATMAALSNEYPAADYMPLRAAAAAAHGVEPDWVVPGAGIDELLLIAARALLPPGGVAVADTPAYPMYRIATAQAGGRFEEVPRPPALCFPADDLETMAAKADLVWLCIPHNPTGQRPDDVDIDRVVDAAGGFTVIDAAYAEVAGDSWVARLEANPRLVVLHTLSKAHGMAGIRVGYALCHPEVALLIHAMRPPGSVSRVSQALAARSLTDTNWMEANALALRTARNDLSAALGNRWKPLPSATNFVLFEVGVSAAETALRLERRGLIVRSYASPPLAGHLRITARSADEQQRLVEAIAAVADD